MYMFACMRVRFSSNSAHAAELDTDIISRTVENIYTSLAGE